MSKQITAIEKRSNAQRLDKWLWYVRMVKTRSLAAALVRDGKVRVNRERTTKPGYLVKIDDVITVTVQGRVRILKVLAPGSRRGTAPEAAQLYEDLTPAFEHCVTQPGLPETGRRKGERPTKRDRRALDRLQRSGSDFK
ncbi:MAG: RNA-binding S4 domain-containing protein [Pseudomonadota bacterium]